MVLKLLVKLYGWINLYIGAGGSSVNYTHLSLLTDFMTHLGEIISVDRHGLNKVNIDPLTRASFENYEYFTNAALLTKLMLWDLYHQE